MNVELNPVYFQPPSSHHPYSDTSTMTTPCFKGTTVMPSVPTSTSLSQSRLPHSGNFCTGCWQTGHIVDDCPQHGGEQESSTTKRSMPSAHAFVADVVVDPDNDGGAVLHDQHSSSLSGAEEEDTPTSFTVLDTTLFVSPTPTSPVNNKVYLDSY